MALASYIIFDENMSVKNNEGARRKFLTELSEDLVRPYVEERSRNIKVTSNFVSRSGIEAFLNEKIQVINYEKYIIKSKF